jgi:hypothetical protein
MTNEEPPRVNKNTYNEMIAMVRELMHRPKGEQITALHFLLVQCGMEEKRDDDRAPLLLSSSVMSSSSSSSSFTSMTPSRGTGKVTLWRRTMAEVILAVLRGKVSGAQPARTTHNTQGINIVDQTTP